jgi:hypothetical protein
MVLAEAFMKRNDLKKKIAVLSAAAAENLWQDKSLPTTFMQGVKQNPKDAYVRANELMSELQALNAAIAKANIVNSDMLRELETVSARIALHEGIVRMAANYPGDKVRDRDYVGHEVVTITRENEWLIDPSAVQVELARLRDRKRELEKALQHSNFVTEVVV